VLLGTETTISKSGGMAPDFTKGKGVMVVRFGS